MNNLYFTDYHDIEMMMVYSDSAFKKVCSEYLKNGKDCLIIRDLILEILYFLSIIKLNNIKHNLGVTFLGSFINFFDFDKETFDIVGYLSVVKNHGMNKNKNIDYSKLNNHDVINDYYNLCNGHDFMKAMAKVISAKKIKKKGIGEDDLSKDFRLAYTVEEFEKSNLFRNLNDWYKLLFLL